MRGFVVAGNSQFTLPLTEENLVTQQQVPVPPGTYAFQYVFDGQTQSPQQQISLTV